MSEKKGKWDFALSMLFGGLSGCCATAVVQPIDTIKVRIQIVSEEKGMKLAGKAAQRSTSPFDVAGEMYKQDGFLAFWRGLPAGLLRQMTYCTIRMGLYKYVYDEFKVKNGRNFYIWEKALLSMATGLVGSWCGNPADIVLVRFQVDSMAPPEKRRNYTGLVNALSRIIKEEGIYTLWRGSYPTVVRAIAMNVGMLTTYDQVKETIVKYTQDENSYTTKFVSSTIAGFVCAFMSLPPDNIKTKLMKMKKMEDGKMPYTGVYDCFKKTIQREGISKLWIGYPTFCVRVAPHAIISLLVQDGLHNLFINNH